MRLLFALFVWLLRATLLSRRALALENLALRQQLATYARTQRRPRLKPEERVFWVALSRVWQSWRSPLLIVKPATVVDWHRRAFRRYWRWRCRRPAGWREVSTPVRWLQSEPNLGYRHRPEQRAHRRPSGGDGGAYK